MLLTLRARLFLFFGGLMALLLGAQWYLARALSKELREESGVMAMTLSTQVMSLFGTELEAQEAGAEGRRASVTLDYSPGSAEREIHVTKLLGDLQGAQAAPSRGVLFALGSPTLGALQRQRVLLEHETSKHPFTPEELQGLARSLTEECREEPGSETHVGLVQLELSDGRGFELVPGSPRLEHAPFSGKWQVATSTEGAAGVQRPGEEMALELKFFSSPLVPGETADAFRFGPREPAQESADATQFLRLVQRSALAGPVEPSESHASDGLGARIPIPVQGMRASIDSFRSRLWLGSLAILALGLGVAGWLAHRVASPMRSLANAADAVGKGQLGLQVASTSDPEVAATIAAFNRMSRQLEELAAEATRLREREHLGELGEVARGLAHTLRNPLNVLGLTIEELARLPQEPQEPQESEGAGPAAAPVRESLRCKARREVRRIDDTLKSFLSLASSGGVPERVALEGVARDVALELSQAGGSVRVLAPPERIELLAVPAEIRAVLHTLVVNAVEASPAGSPVEVSVRATAQGAELRIEDRGPGVDARVRQRLFTPHVTTKPTGAGMGLYLANRIVTSRYSGSLRLEEREGGGTRATLTIGRRSEEAGA